MHVFRCSVSRVDHNSDMSAAYDVMTSRPECAMKTSTMLLCVSDVALNARYLCDITDLYNFACRGTCDFGLQEIHGCSSDWRIMPSTADVFTIPGCAWSTSVMPLSFMADSSSSLRTGVRLARALFNTLEDDDARDCTLADVGGHSLCVRCSTPSCPYASE